MSGWESPVDVAAGLSLSELSFLEEGKREDSGKRKGEMVNGAGADLRMGSKGRAAKMLEPKVLYRAGGVRIVKIPQRHSSKLCHTTDTLFHI